MTATSDTRATPPSPSVRMPGVSDLRKVTPLSKRTLLAKDVKSPKSPAKVDAGNPVTSKFGAGELVNRKASTAFDHRGYPDENAGLIHGPLPPNTKHPHNFETEATLEENLRMLKLKVNSRARNDKDVKRNILRTFRQFDRNGDNSVTKEELDRTLRTFFLTSLTKTQCDELFDYIDTDKSGEIDKHEFLAER